MDASMQHRRGSSNKPSPSGVPESSEKAKSASLKASLRALTASHSNHRHKSILIAVVFLLALIGLSFTQPKSTSTGNATSNNEKAMPQESSSVSTSKKEAKKAVEDVPECEATPWRKNEDMVGTCPGIKPAPDHKNIASAAECARSCCASKECVTWQYRADKGCLQTEDVRIGQEKDGPSGYCSDHPPLRWQGQKLKDGRKSTECSVDTWHPNEEQGQCFGLGDKRKGKFETAQDCMEACCADKDCLAWQFQETLGCFYNKGMFSCQPSDDPIVFEPYVGRRKHQPERTYTDTHGNPTFQKKR